jgi:hypothetical protein
MRRVGWNEWPWVIAFALIVMAVVSLPYVAGWLKSDATWRFSGFVIGVEDGNSYLAKMQEGAHGQWLFQLSYAVEDHPPALAFLFFILLGKLIGSLVGTQDPVRLHDALAVGFHVARFTLGIVQIGMTYVFLAEMLPRVRQRRLALIVASLCGGLGWLLLAWPQLGQPLEVYSPEAFSFLHLYMLPHLEAVRALLLAGLLCHLRAVRGSWKWSLAGGLCWFALTLVQPFYMVIVLGILGMHVIMLALFSLRQAEPDGKAAAELGPSAVKAVWVAAIAAVFGLPVVIYTFLLFQVDPIYRIWSAQNIILSPPPIHYLSAWGLCVMAGLLGFRSIQRRQPVLAALVFGWLLLVPLLLYAPYNLQRRFAEGIYVPMAGLAVLGLTIGTGRAPMRRAISRYGPLVLIALTLPATGLVWIGGMAVALHTSSPVFQQRDQTMAYDYLARRLPARSVVLSSFAFGNAVPAYGYLVAYMGHGPETPNLLLKRNNAELFFGLRTSQFDRREVYFAMGTPYVVVTPQDRANGFDPARQTDYLQMVFQSGDYSVWALK